MNEESPRSLVAFPRSVWVLVGVWLAMTLGAVVWAIPHEEEHLTDQSVRALAGTRMSASFEGRDAMLHGVALEDVELDRAVVDLLGVRGVRRVTVGEVEIAADAAMPVSALVFTVDGGRASIEGFIPDSATEDVVVAAAVAAFGEGNVAADLDVEPRVTGAPWLIDVTEAIAVLPDMRRGSVEFTPDVIIAEGEVESPEIRQRIIARLTRVAHGVAVDDRLVVAAGGDAMFAAELSADRLSLAGELPTSQLIDDIEGSAALFYGTDTVTSALREGLVEDGPHLSHLPELLDALRPVQEWAIDLVGTRVRITGSGIGEAALDAAATEIADLFGGSVDLGIEFDVDEVGVAASLTELLEGSTNFAAGSAELSAEATAKLDEAIAILQANPSTRVSVEGHTDDEGSEASNLALSQARAEAVVAYLVAGGIDPARLSAVGFGESMPIESNDTEAGKAANRRIEFVVIEGDE